eukprot:5116365-Pyramimonas_sp.AAC.1
MVASSTFSSLPSHGELVAGHEPHSALRLLHRGEQPAGVPGRGGGHAQRWVTVPHCTALYRTVPHCTALYRTALYRTAPHRTALYRTAPHCTALYRTALYRTAPHCTVPHRTVDPCTAPHCTCAALCSSPLSIHGGVQQ